MTYDAEFSNRAETDLSGLDPPVEQRVRRRICEMAASAQTWPHQALTGQYRGLFRLRVGNYRVRYDLDHTNRRIIILRVQHRSEAYR
ncbi:MAG: type II toxin-antitoxin system RelE/ParE family toxin [Chloroflexota bacterium]|nr:type II toxin-antitoxin system RelE/ParE family toxin [Chloroflexota bacterium]MDE2960949.1 type II toxin-antitoxin system RelE/ParE family toxin [Chloroflexota bacterium]